VFDRAEFLDKLERLRRSDPNHRLFGAIGHHYLLNPTLSPQVVSVFERRHQIELPEDYRAFLVELGNGGVGPFYGVFKLGETYESTWQEGDGFVGILRNPFPHRTPWNWPQERLAQPESFPSEEAETEWNARFDAEYYDASLVDGAIPICEHGCALRTWLVVHGPERGKVWYDARADLGGLEPHLAADGRALTFSDWYRGWLDRSLVEISRR
jgi:hypothetical protein